MGNEEKIGSLSKEAMMTVCSVELIVLRLEGSTSWLPGIEKKNKGEEKRLAQTL